MLPDNNLYLDTNHNLFDIFPNILKSNLNKEKLFFFFCHHITKTQKNENMRGFFFDFYPEFSPEFFIFRNLPDFSKLIPIELKKKDLLTPVLFITRFTDLFLVNSW